MARKKYYGHSGKNSNKSDWQLLRGHLMDTADIAKNFAEPIGLAKTAYLVGLMHDLGKYSDEFQDRIEPGYRGPKVDHATAGAKELTARIDNMCLELEITPQQERSLKILGKLISYAIAGHHTGLPDWGDRFGAGSLEYRLVGDVPDYHEYLREIEIDVDDRHVEEISRFIYGDRDNVKRGASAFLLVKMLYSCLVDADFLDTEKVMDEGRSKARSSECDNMHRLLEKFETHMAEKTRGAEGSPLGRIRSSILAQCDDKAMLEPGLFTLTVPTGGGKTLSSLSFALRHAVKNKMDRIIYVIPYTSIIEQTAGEFKRALGENNVLEHHSNYQPPKDQDEELTAAMMLAQENWDSPVVVTTSVQFFESIFSNRSSKLRKLHNIAGSVIILDEAQMVPFIYAKPILAALNELVRSYGCTVVLCTATQPAFEHIPGDWIPQATEMMDDPQGLYESLKRVEVVRSEGVLSDDAIAAALKENSQMLCIVNTKKHARNIYLKAKEKKATCVYHLSTNMCPAHRSKVLKKIRQRLDRNSPRPCRVVSTQLIEAGVDVDFPKVYRSAAGIDSLAQSAGRCNREGRLERGEVRYFIPESHGLPKGTFTMLAQLGMKTASDHSDDPLSLDSIEDYFSELYFYGAQGLDAKGITGLFSESASISDVPYEMAFKRISDLFKMIESDTVTVVVPYDAKARRLTARLRRPKIDKRTFRQLQQYTVQVYEKPQFENLKALGAIETINDTVNILTDMSLYHKDFGLCI